MNDLELQARLKSAPIPARPDEYWDDFPAQVRRQLRPALAARAPRSTWPKPLRWTADFALATALVLLLCLQLHALRVTCAVLDQHGRSFQKQIARLDAGLHQLMMNTNGLGNLLTDAN